MDGGSFSYGKPGAGRATAKSHVHPGCSESVSESVSKLPSGSLSTPENNIGRGAPPKADTDTDNSASHVASVPEGRELLLPHDFDAALRGPGTLG